MRYLATINQSLQLATTTKPILQNNEVLLKVTGFGLNRADTLQIKGMYPPPPGASQIVGLEASGYICNQEGQPDYSKLYMALLKGGAYAEYVQVHKDHLIEVPSNLNIAQASGFMEQYLTPFLQLFKIGELDQTKSILAYAGASSIGISSIQLCKLLNITPIVTVSTDEKVEYVKNLGAIPINYKKENVHERVKELTNQKGVDIVMDCVGSSLLEDTIQSLKVDGKWILYGLMGGNKVNLNLGQILAKRIQLIGTTLRSRSDEFKIDLINSFKLQFLDLVKQNKLLPVISYEITIDWNDKDCADKVNAQLKDMESNITTGKAVVIIKQ